MKNKTYALFIALCSITLLSITTAKAQDTQNIESVGLYGAGHPNSLGSGIYHNASRSGLANALKHAGLGRWITLERKINDFLLTSADPSLLKNDVEPQQSNNLFTLRLNALLKRGMNKEAFDLYTKISDTAQHEKLVRLGVYSMLFNKEKALACLEVKARFTDFDSIDVWQELNAYCNSTLSMGDEATKSTTIKSAVIKNVVSSPDYTIEYTTEAFATLTFMEKAILTAEDRITLSSPHLKIAYPARELQPLLKQTKIDTTTKTLLTLHAVKSGILPPTALTEQYEALYQENKNTQTHGKSVPSKLANLYDEADTTWSSKKRAQKLAQAFEIIAQHDAVALIPFVPLLQKTDIAEELKPEHFHATFTAVLYADEYTPNDWVKSLQKRTSKEADPSAKAQLQKWLLICLLLSEKPYDDAFSFKDYDLSEYYKAQQYTLDIKNIIENIDSPQNNGDKLRYVYNSAFDLLSNNGYTMPSYIRMNALEQSGQNQDIGATLLLSSLILSNIAPNALYSGTLGDVTIAIDNIGFTDVSYRVMAQAILEKTN